MQVKPRRTHSLNQVQDTDPGLTLQVLDSNLQVQEETLEKLTRIQKLQSNQLKILHQDLKNSLLSYEKIRDLIIKSSSDSLFILNIPPEFKNLIETPFLKVNDQASLRSLLSSFNYCNLSDHQIESYFPLWKSIKNLTGAQKPCFEFIVTIVEVKMKHDLHSSAESRLKTTQNSIKSLQKNIQNLKLVQEKLSNLVLSETKDEYSSSILSKPDFFLNSQELYGSSQESINTSTIIFQSAEETCTGCRCFVM
jgi:hypothetical protein